MLRIYKGNGTFDKEKFIYSRIDPHRKTILIVPDQFSLQAERDAFRFMGRESLTELMIVDFSILGHKIVHEVCGREPEIIDKYGRHMLLSVIIDELGDELEAFGSAKARNSFVDHMNTMISELKRYEISPDMLEAICGDLEKKQEGGDRSGTYLTMKLADILKIYRAYEGAIQGTYSDAEDYITYYAQRISGSEIVRDAEVWIYGFDTFSPKHLLVIRELMAATKSVSVVLTGEPGDETGSTGAAASSGSGSVGADGEPGGSVGADSEPGGSGEAGSTRVAAGDEDPVRALTLNEGESLFELTDMVADRLEEMAAEIGIPCERDTIHMKRETLWDLPEDERRQRITLANTSDHHREAERAAAYIQSLVREEGYRYGDIALVCNDGEGLSAMVHRALVRMGIPVFADRRRHVLHQPVVSFLLSFLDVIEHGYRSESVMAMVKSGLLGWTDEQESLLENYVREFRIGPSRWKEPFLYKGDTYTDEELKELNEMRAFILDSCEGAKDSIGRRNRAAERIRGLHEFLRVDMEMPAKIEEVIDRQSRMEMMEGASETAQIWNAICGIFDQIVRVIGDRRISNGTLSEMIRAGLTSLDVGMIPMTGDCVMIGTLQRSRPGDIRALVIVGAEEGLLPLHGQDDGLLTEKELKVLGEMDLELARKKSVAAMEEQLAIYRMCSLPSERLYVSWSQTGSGQVAARASSLFTSLEGYGSEVLGDLGREDPMENVVDPETTISYLAEAMRGEGRGDARWAEVRNWYVENDPEALARIERGSKPGKLDPDMARVLYMGDAKAMNVSASRLETFGSCPFAHFIKYGLGPREQKLFEVGGREIGNVYHNCIMEYCRNLTAEEGRPGLPGWKDITKEECVARVDQILDRNEKECEGGVFGSDEESRFRMERIREICGDIAWVITEQIRAGEIRSMSFEEEFGRRSKLPATEFEIDGRKFKLTGKIDRMDTMGPIRVSDGSSVRIIDYKTGGNQIDTEEIRRGYQLQLAIYMDAARHSGDVQPAGIFYFKIREFVTGTEAGKEMDPEELEAKIRKAYRLEGVAVNDPEIIRGMDKGFAGGDKRESTVIPVKYDPDKGGYKRTGGGDLMSDEDFGKLLDESRKHAERICREFYLGRIDAKPHRSGSKDWDGNDVTACTYCDFGSICMHDRRLG